MCMRHEHFQPARHDCEHLRQMRRCVHPGRLNGSQKDKRGSGARSRPQLALRCRDSPCARPSPLRRRESDRDEPRSQ
eukprot:3227866-Alexandrium_andersonii.AAC.1